MRRSPFSMALLAFLTLTLTLVVRAGSPELAKALEPLKPLLGKTWKGPLKNSTPEKPVIDVMKWERALNGQGVRILHSINQGEYGGETIIMMNLKSAKLEFHYFTTAGFMTRGTMSLENGRIVTQEEVIGNQNGVTAVKAVMEIRPDGRLHNKSQYLKNGNWEDGHEVIYEEAPGAEVVFK